MLLRQSLILEGKILVEKESPEMSGLLAAVTAQSQHSDRKEFESHLSDLKSEILRSTLPQAKWLLDCAKSAFAAHGTYGLEYLVAQFSYTSLLNRSEKWQFESLEDPLLLKAINKLERHEVFLMLDVLLGNKYGSGVLFKELNHVAGTSQGATFQKLFTSYMLEHNPQISADTPYLNAATLKSEVLSQITRSGSPVPPAVPPKRPSRARPRGPTPESGSPSSSPRTTLHADSRNSSPMKKTPGPKMSNPGDVQTSTQCSFTGVNLPLQSMRIACFVTDATEPAPQRFLIISDKRCHLMYLFHYSPEQSKWILTKTFDGVRKKGHPDFVVFPPKAVALFVRGDDNTCLWSLTKNAVDSPWTQWESLGGVLGYDPVVQYLNPLQKYIFARAGTKLLYKDISAPEWLPIDVHSDTFTIEGPLHKACWDSTVFMLLNSTGGFVYSLFNGSTCLPWTPIDLHSAIEPIVFRWGTALSYIGVIGVSNQGTLVQRNFDTTFQQWDTWTTITRLTTSVSALEAVVWSYEEISLLLHTAEGLWTSFGNGNTWNQWLQLT